MLRLIAIYLHYRDLQEERARNGVHAAAPVKLVAPVSAANADDRPTAQALAA